MSPLLTIDRLNAYYGSAQAVFGLCLEVGEGESVALLGRNGAGKTSTLRGIVGAIRRDGDVTFAGVRISRLRTERIARMGVAWVPEDRRIFAGLTVRENIVLATRAAPPDRRMPLDALVSVFPTLESVLDRKGDQLSGGQQQLVAVARAMASRPLLLLLDEPSEGLAPIIVEQLRRQLDVLRRETGVGMLIAEQNMTFVADLAQRAYVLERGQLVYHGSVAELRSSPELQMRYLALHGAAKGASQPRLPERNDNVAG
jgi:ABC-type branched-subunit amino acid transport system ATPase component